jgi:hypothetical protein
LQGVGRLEDREAFGEKDAPDEEPVFGVVFDVKDGRVVFLHVKAPPGWLYFSINYCGLPVINVTGFNQPSEMATRAADKNARTKTAGI